MTISVIIPAYNVEPYIDRCIQSVVHQSFTDFEVIIIDDGSTDNTLLKCREWEQYDSRIKVISKRNQGQGIARNIGIQHSQGQYIAFVDADDWIDRYMLEKSYQRICETEADAVIFDINCVITDENDNILFYKPVKNQLDIPWVASLKDDYSMLYRISGVVWDFLWKKECIEALPMPNHPYEDEFIVAAMLLHVNKIAQLRSELYYYNVCRSGNTTHKESSIAGLETSFIKIREYYKKETGSGILYDMVRIKAMHTYRNLLKNLYSGCSEDRIKLLEEHALTYLKKEFPERKWKIDKRILLIGSYNLRIMVKRVFGNCNEYIDDFSMHSIISAMDKKNLEFSEQTGRSAYEKEMIYKDCMGILLQMLKDKDTQYGCVVIDLLEEVRGIVYKNGHYYTCGQNNRENNRSQSIISFGSEEFKALWKEHFNKLKQLLLSKFEQRQIIVVCNYLNEYQFRMGDLKRMDIIYEMDYLLMYGEYEISIMKKRIAEDLYSMKLQKSCFEHLPAIIKANQILKELYDIAAYELGGVHIIKLDEIYSGTDFYFPLGALPEYYNEAYYLQAADWLKRIFEENAIFNAFKN